MDKIEATRELSKAIAENIIKAATAPEMLAFLGRVKAAPVDDTGTFEVVVSTDNQDRAGDVVDQNGWDLSFYKMNPIVLWAHDYASLPIGVCDSIELQNGKLLAKGRFAPADANPFAQQVRKLYDLRIVRATSVGFIIKDMQGNNIKQQELLEFSFVPVPANPYALSLAKAQALDIEMIKSKGIELEIKNEPAEGSETGKIDLAEAETDENGKTSEPAPDAAAEGNQEAKTIIAEKGPVQDMLNARDQLTWDDLDKKYAYLDEVFEVMGAFCSVFLDDRVPLAQFSPLLTETITILQALAADPESAVEDEPMDGEMDGGEVMCAMKKKTASLSAIMAKRREYTLTKANEAIVKAGRVLSEKNRTLIGETITSLKNSTAVLEELHAATDPQGSAEEKITPKPLKQRSSVAGSNDQEKLDKFLLTREALRLVNNVTSEALAKIKKRGENPKK